MNNSEAFQASTRIMDAVIGVPKGSDPSVSLFHMLAGALAWCDEHKVDFDATLQEVRESFAEDVASDIEQEAHEAGLTVEQYKCKHVWVSSDENGRSYCEQCGADGDA